MNYSRDILIIGGGIIGLTTAYFLAKKGQKVTVLDRGELGQEASWAGAGIIPPGNPERAATPLDQLRARSVSLLPVFSAELKQLTGLDNGYRVCGGIEFLTPEDEYAVELWRAEGLVFTELSADELQVREPQVRAVPGVRAYEFPGFAQVRNPWHLQALIAACTRLGVELLPHSPVHGWQRDGSRITGALLENVTLQADRFLLSAGAWSEGLLSQLGVSLGIHPVKGQIVLYRCETRPFQRILMHGKRYLVPREDGRVLVGATEEIEAEFNKESTKTSIDELKKFATELVPGLLNAEVEKTWAGLRPGSRDKLPMIGQVPEYSNFFVAAGHYRAGVQLSAATGQGLTEMLISGITPHWLEPFQLDRPETSVTLTAFRS
jgi:glycine oxidase